MSYLHIGWVFVDNISAEKLPLVFLFQARVHLLAIVIRTLKTFPFYSNTAYPVFFVKMSNCSNIVFLTLQRALSEEHNNYFKK